MTEEKSVPSPDCIKSSYRGASTWRRCMSRSVSSPGGSKRGARRIERPPFDLLAACCSALLMIEVDNMVEEEDGSSSWGMWDSGRTRGALSGSETALLSM